MSRRRHVSTALAALALLAVATAAGSYSTYAKWATWPVTFYVNPANADVTTSAAAAAVQYAMDVWNTQSGTSFRYHYGGVVSDTASKFDNRNVFIFRNATNGGSIGTTYTWWDANKKLLDSDVIMWSGNFRFFTGTSGCGVVVNAVYIEDVAAHEFGHALGLNHSSSSSATMYPSYSYCSQAFRTLSPDDIGGVKSLYPATVAAPTNTPPTVVITSPANGATFQTGSSISLAATATDSQDGNISSRVTWTDNGAPIGSGNLLSSLLSVAGVHTFVARVTDNNGATASSQVSITVTLLQGLTTTGTLTATKSVSTTWQRVLLKWKGVAGTSADVFRNNAKIAVVGNDGDWLNQIASTSPGTYYYYVCSSGTSKCTNTIKVVF